MIVKMRKWIAGSFATALSLFYIDAMIRQGEWHLLIAVALNAGLLTILVWKDQ